MTKKLILLIEDDATIREQMAEIIAGEDYPVETAENGEAALALLRILPTPPALILLDIMMPVMDGQEFLERLQNRAEYAAFRDIPVVIVSAKRVPLHGRVAAIVEKPPQLDELFELAKKYAGGGED